LGSTNQEQIHDCRLFMPIVSANSEARVEGYFRREWKLAVDRTHDLSERVAFRVPIVIDSTPEAKADVPDAFRHVIMFAFPMPKRICAAARDDARVARVRARKNFAVSVWIVPASETMKAHHCSVKFAASFKQPGSRT